MAPSAKEQAELPQTEAPRITVAAARTPSLQMLPPVVQQLHSNHMHLYSRSRQLGVGRVSECVSSVIRKRPFCTEGMMITPKLTKYYTHLAELFEGNEMLVQHFIRSYRVSGHMLTFLIFLSLFTNLIPSLLCRGVTRGSCGDLLSSSMHVSHQIDLLNIHRSLHEHSCFYTCPHNKLHLEQSPLFMQLFSILLAPHLPEGVPHALTTYRPHWILKFIPNVPTLCLYATITS